MAGDQVFMEVPAVRNMSKNFQQISQTLKQVCNTLQVLSNILKTTAFIGMVGGAVVGWVDNSQAETRFEILRTVGFGSGNPTYTLVGSVGVNVSAYTDDDVQPESTYTYRVRAVNDVGSSSLSPFATVTTPTFAPSGAVAATLSPSPTGRRKVVCRRTIRMSVRQAATACSSIPIRSMPWTMGP